MNYFLLHQREKLLQHGHAFICCLISFSIFMAAYHLKWLFNTPYSKIPHLKHFSEFLMFVPLWYLIFYLPNYPKTLRTKTSWAIFIETSQKVSLGVIIIISYIYLLKRRELSSRLLIGFFYIFDIIGLYLLNLFIKRLLIYFSKKEALWMRKIIVVGRKEERKDILDVFKKEDRLGIKVVGILGMEEENLKDEDKLFLGTIEGLEKVLERGGIDEVIFAVNHHDLDKIRGSLIICREFGVDARINSTIFAGLVAHTRLDRIGEIPLLTFSTTPTQVWQLFIKEILDRLFGLILLILLFPVFIIISVLIKLTSKGPIFFVQERSGLNGRKFRFYKFRTMVADAEKLLDSIAHLNEVSGPVFKIKNDPRITTLGKFLRRFSLDELPQIYNIVKGDMSFIGPRPPIPSEVEKYERWQRRRLSMKPGLTCVWQVSGRSGVQFSEWMKMDLEYIDNWSLKLDLWILIKTIPAVIKGKGAM